MKEIVNRGTGPLQLMVRSKNKASGFTTKILFGRGSGKNICYLPDEQMTEQIELLNREKLISIKDLSAKEWSEKHT